MKALLLALLLLAAQDPAAKKPDPPVDCIFLQDRTELRGEIAAFSAAGRLQLRLPKIERPVDVAVEEIARIRFSTDPIRPLAPAGEQARLSGGGLVSGRIASFDGDVALIEGPAGAFRIRRADLKSLLLAAPESRLPDLREEKKDVLVVEVEKKPSGKECIAEYGRLKSIGEKVVFQATVPAEGDAKEKTVDKEFERAAVKHVYLWRDTPLAEPNPGLFTKVTLRNGDRWVAILESVGKDRVRLFSHVFGSVEIEKARIHTLSFIQQSQLTAGNILVTDQAGIHEFDSQKQEVWSYTQGAQGAAMARKLRNGNVLVADQNTNTVIEIRPSPGRGGEIVWRLDEVQNPMDAWRLDNGNTLVTERYNNRVAEYDGKTRDVVWQIPVQYPMSAQRLENGNTLIATSNNVFEVNKANQEQWRANLLRGGAIRPTRATRLENGNTLIVDHSKGQVVEIDANSAEVWKATGLINPAQAVRLEDGNTLILEQGLNKIVEADAVNPQIRTEVIRRGLNVPQGLSTY